MKNKINPYRRNAEVLRDFFRQPLLLVISIILTISFLTQTLLSVYSFLTIKESASSNTYIISILPIMGFLSLFISAHKNRTDFFPKSGLLTLAIYNIVTIALTSLFIAIQIILYFIKPDRLLKLFSLQSDDLITGAMLCAVAVSTISIIFAVFSLVLINLIRKSFKSIYLFKSGSVAYSILALVSALLYIGFLALHFISSSAEYRSSAYFFLTSAVFILEFITYILYTVFGFSYNSFIKRISTGITESKNEIEIFTSKPKNENYKPLNMWDDDNSKKTKKFKPQNVFSDIEEDQAAPSEFDMWNKPEEIIEEEQVEPPYIPPQAIYELTHKDENKNPQSSNYAPPQTNNSEVQTIGINPDPVFRSANSTETKHNKFEKWNDEVKSKLESFDNDFKSHTNAQKSSAIENSSDKNPFLGTPFVENLTPHPVSVDKNKAMENNQTQAEPTYQPTTPTSAYVPVSNEVTPDVQVGAEFIPQHNNSDARRNASLPANEDFASVQLWNEPIMPKGRKTTETPAIFMEHHNNTAFSSNQPAPSPARKGDFDGNEYINTLWETPVMNYGSSRPIKNSYSENPYVNPIKKDKKVKKSKKDKKNRNNIDNQQYQIQPIICPNCGSVCSSDVYFCVKCGTILKR